MEPAASERPPARVIDGPLASPLISEDIFRLAKVVGVLAILSSAVVNEFGVTINYASTNSLTVYPGAQNLVPLAVVVAGLVLIPKIFLYMRFSANAPRAGSIYVWISRSLSEPVGFVGSFLNWIGICGAVGLIAYAGATFLSSALILAGFSGGSALVTPEGHLIFGLALIWAVFGLHAAGVRIYGLSVTILLGVILLSVLLIAVVGFTTTPHTFVTDAYTATHVRLRAPTHPSSPSAGAFLSVVGLMIAAYGGVNSSTFLGGEARNATTTVPRGLLLGWATALVVYAIVIFAVFNAVPYWATLGLIKHNAGSFATAPGLIGVVAPHALGVVLGLIVAVIVSKTMLPLMLVQSRQAFAWAEDGLFPRVFQNTSRRKAPSAALLLGAVIGSVFLVQSTFIGWEIGIVIRSLSILLMLLLVAAGALRMKYGTSFRNRPEPWVKGITRGFGVTVAATLGILVALLVGQSVFVTPGVAVPFQPWFQLAIGCVVGAGLYYWFAPRRASSPTAGGLAEVNSTLPLE